MDSLGQLDRYGGPIAHQGYRSLLQILKSQGATDPRLQNRNLADMDIQNQLAYRQAQGGLAQQGMTSTGAGQGLLSATAQGGIAQRADYLGKEAALQEERKRQNLQLMQLMFGPQFQNQALRNQLSIAELQSRSGQMGGFDLGGLLSGVGSLALAFV